MERGHELYLQEGMKRLDKLQITLDALAGSSGASATESTLFVRAAVESIDADTTSIDATLTVIDSVLDDIKTNGDTANTSLATIILALGNIDANTDGLETQLASLISGQGSQATAANQSSANTKLDSIITALGLQATVAKQNDIIAAINNVSISPVLYDSNGKAQLTISNIVVGLGIIPADSVGAFLSVEDAPIRITFNPDLPTSAIGLLVEKGSQIKIGEPYGFSADQLIDIRLRRTTGANATVNVQYFKLA